MKIGDYVAFEPADGNLRISVMSIVHMSQPGIVTGPDDMPDLSGSIKVDFGPSVIRSRFILRDYWCRAADCRVIDEKEYARLKALAVLGCL